MSKKRLVKISLFILLVVVPASAFATTIVRTGETVSVEADQVVAGDFYTFGGTVSNSGLIEGDLYAAAGSFTNNGTIDGDLSVMAGSAQVHASVTDDVRVLGGEVVIAGNVGGDVVMVGGLLKVLSTATIEGDILFFGGELQVMGAVAGSVLGTAEKARIDSTVGESIDMKIGVLTLGDRAEILGDVRYTSVTDVVRSQNAVINGELVKNTSSVDETGVSFEQNIISFIIILFSALVLQLLFRARLLTSLPGLTTNIGMAGLIGLVALCTTPLLIIVSVASMLGLLVGLIILSAFIFLLLLAAALSSILLGALLNKYISGNINLSVLYTIIGAGILQILFVIPLIGAILLLVVLAITFGALLRSVYFNL